jgi:hypothetical protein
MKIKNQDNPNEVLLTFIIGVIVLVIEKILVEIYLK